MDASRFNDLIRFFSNSATRRGITGALTGLSLASLLGLAGANARRKKKKKCKGKKKCGKRCIPRSACCTAAECANDGETCVNGSCVCPDGQDACGGLCRDSCPAERVRDPNSCGCCRPSNVIENVCGDPISDVCCSGLLCKPISGSGEGTRCEGWLLGQPCSFNAQCASNYCNPNLVCA